MKKIHIIATLAVVLGLSGCKDFLSETPNKSGSAYINHMDQLYGLMGNYSLYRSGYCWSELIFRGDGVEYSPYYYKNFNPTANAYSVWSWDNTYLATDNSVANCTWTPSWNAIFSFNTVLENMDRVEQTTPAVRKQVEGEALFGRAYYHFLLLVQYALWDDNAPGIGYRTDALPSDMSVMPERKTVKYTLDCIYKDLDDAEAALTAAGRTTFELARNFRPTVPTLKALRARIDLYRGNYTSALANANAALAAYDYLLDFKNDPEYALNYEAEPLKFLNSTDTAVDSTFQYRRMQQLLTKGGEAFAKHPEFYLPHQSDLFFANRILPISESYYDLFDHENDERWKRFYNNNYITYQTSIAKTVNIGGVDIPKCFTWADQQGIKEANRHAYQRFASQNGSSGKYYLLGMTTAEMYLIKAECLARAGRTSEAAEELKTLRRTRFTTEAEADNIGGSVEEVLDERAREMTELWRFFDIKRLNGKENAGIKIKRTLPGSTAGSPDVDVEILPDDPRWALPFTFQQVVLMGWEQNAL
ncbi:MAG: RagB/SusD family nutrient uptake outer membrane protein [Rikenellaceae bacterium]|jgi:hypothetical protein|nr:RagB/SusD family nutrient uptake outer membrane protein [Rikenellaceae bacterium]